MVLLERPIRVSMIIACAKKYPAEQAAAIVYDEFKTTLVEMGIDRKKVVGMKDDSLETMSKVKGMSEKEAFDYLVRIFKRRLLELGVDRSVIRALRFE